MREQAPGHGCPGRQRVAQVGDIVGQRDVDDRRSDRGDAKAQGALAQPPVEDRGVLAERGDHGRHLVAGGAADVVEAARRVLDDVGQQPGDLRGLVVPEVTAGFPSNME